MKKQRFYGPPGSAQNFFPFNFILNSTGGAINSGIHKRQAVKDK